MFRKETSRELKPMDNLKPQKVKSGRSKSRSGARTASSKNITDKENKNEPNISHQHLMDSEGWTFSFCKTGPMAQLLQKA